MGWSSKRNWTGFLIKRSVNVVLPRKQSRDKALVDLMYKENFVIIKSNDLFVDPEDRDAEIDEPMPPMKEQEERQKQRSEIYPFMNPNRRGNEIPKEKKLLTPHQEEI